MNYSYPLFRPPSEAASFIVQLSYGCSSNTCQFCGMYKSVKYSKRNVEDVIAEIKNIPDYYRNDIKRIFIADGDPIHSGFEVLKTLVVFLNRFFPNLQRISAYALPQSVLKLTEPELEILNKLKLKLFYMGLETGSDELYKFISKKGSVEDLINACLLIKKTGGKTSITAVLGLGGKDFTDVHAEETAKAVNKANPDFFSLLTLIYGGNDKYIEKIKLLSRREIMLEMKKIISNIESKTIFRSNHISNLAMLSGVLPKDKNKLIEEIDYVIQKNTDNADFIKPPQFDGESGY